MITREQVADLQPGDVVELGWTNKFDEGVEMTARGTLRTTATSGDAPRALFLAKYCVRDMRGDPVYGDRRTLTVVSRAPRPLYVNHPRTSPVPGDVVREEYEGDGWTVWFFDRERVGRSESGGRCRATEMVGTLRLLVDGETGQAVP